MNMPYRMAASISVNNSSTAIEITQPAALIFLSNKAPVKPRIMVMATRTKDSISFVLILMVSSSTTTSFALDEMKETICNKRKQAAMMNISTTTYFSRKFNEGLCSIISIDVQCG